jgi:hypothetical protein
MTTAAEDFQHMLFEVLPKAAHGKISVIMDAYATDLLSVEGADVVNGRIPVETVKVGTWEIGIDAAGNATCVDFGDDAVELRLR